MSQFIVLKRGYTQRFGARATKNTADSEPLVIRDTFVKIIKVILLET